MGIIGSIRKHSWIAVTIVGIAIIAFIIGDLTKNNRGIPDMGKINGTTITAQHFEMLMDEMENNYKRQQGVEQIPSDVEYQLREQVWQNLVDETLMEDQFAKLGIGVSSSELSDMYSGKFIHPYLRQMFTDPKTGEYNMQAIQYYTENFDQLDTAARQQWVELEKYVKKDRLQQKYAALIGKALYMPKAIAAKVADMGSTVANVRVVDLAYQTLDNEEANPTEEDYQNYFKEHMAEFRVREELRELNFIVYPLNPTAEDMQKIQNDVAQVYEEFQSQETQEIPFFVNSESDRSYDSTYMKPSAFAPLDTVIASTPEGGFIAPRLVGNQWMMAKVISTAVRPDSMRASTIYILNQRAGGNITRSDEQAKILADSISTLLKSNKISFEDAVAQYSDDPQKGDTKGDMDWQPDGGFGFLNEDILNTPVGGIFTFKHPNEVGYFIVKVTDKTPATKKYRVALITREIVPSETTARNIFNLANQFAGQNRTYQEMIAAAQAENLQVRNAMCNAMTNQLQGVNNARSIVQWAFNEKTKVGDVADQVFEADNMYVVATLKDVYKKGYPTLDQVRSMIEPQVRIDKKAEVLMARAEEAKAAKDINAIATKLNAVVDSIDSVSFNDYFFGKFGLEPKVQSAIAAAQGQKLLGPVKGASGVFMVQVDAVAKKEAADVDALRQSMEQNYLQKLRVISQVLKDKNKVIDQRNKFF